MSQEILNNVRKNLFRIDPYVPGKPIGEVKKEYGLQEVVKLASNENPLGPSQKVQEAIAAALGDLHRYPDGGAVNLKAAIAAKFDMPVKQILVGNGSDEVIKMISETFLNPGDEVVLPTPSFSQYWFGTQLMSGTSVQVPLTADFEYDLEAMLAAVNEKTKLVYICSPNNPTGTCVRRAEMQSFLDRLPKHVLVVFDEAYNEYGEADDLAQGIDFLKAGYNVLVMRTFSKLYALAALRIGYTFGSAEVIDAINRSREPFNVNHLAQVAGVAALQDDEHIAQSRRINREGIAQLTAGLNALGYAVIPTQANFLLFDTRTDDKQLFHALLREGVIVRSGTALGVPRHLRITVGTAEENTKFLTSFAKVVSQFPEQV